MTCIVGVEYAGGVVLGGDSAGVSGWSITPRADEKVFKRTGPDGQEWGFGFCGSFRLGQLIRHALDLPGVGPTAQSDLDRFMVVVFVDLVRECLKEAGARGRENEVESQEGAFFVALRGRLYCVEGDFQVGRSRYPFHAIGCGRDEAKGAMHALSFALEDLPADEIAESGLQAASDMNGGVCAPFEYVEVLA